MIDEKIRIKSYTAAVHTMTTPELDTAVKEKELELAASKKNTDHLESVLAGYKQARKERK